MKFPTKEELVKVFGEQGEEAYQLLATEDLESIYQKYPDTRGLHNRGPFRTTIGGLPLEVVVKLLAVHLLLCPYHVNFWGRPSMNPGWIAMTFDVETDQFLICPDLLPSVETPNKGDSSKEDVPTEESATAPTLERCVEAFKDKGAEVHRVLTEESIEAILAKYPTALHYHSLCSHGSEEAKVRLHAVDEILGTHGIEGLTYPDQRYGFSYCNTGETYQVTVVYDSDNDQFHVTSWGDFVEAYEQKQAEEDDEDDIAGVHENEPEEYDDEEAEDDEDAWRAELEESADSAPIFLVRHTTDGTLLRLQSSDLTGLMRAPPEQELHCYECRTDGCEVQVICKKEDLFFVGTLEPDK